ncbi:S1 RNA-binding domain-containing protein [Lactobacillus gigeriorum]|uniref:S1 family RNA-binding protein n=1 Tax=Lactobacillus gigeriorum DSM 23908 = CRBIP 24.85 TaxID=1423751 RepID=I7K032_9LACO|nr:S1 RNA-binding domain-containing protein [Lactobacillus gigeriorum]KRN14375.1 S1 family RNA-binding protein [Lactobacillus gigeriorum DSM 23908 = CRBIP 24.85]CCI86620.1 S1 family RNA-binding protein [Lactobacillus gigeriorum DSM 23908 = CRBIP 24.85]
MKYQVGQRVTGIINNVGDIGLFLTLPGHRSGLIHHSDWSGNWSRERNRYRVGDELRVVVTKVAKGRIALSLARLNDPDLLDPTNQVSNVSKTDFAKVMTTTLSDSHQEIAKLTQALDRFS